MIRRAAFSVAVLLVATVAAPGAMAQTRIRGGGSFDQAPALTPGTLYKDTIILGEQIYYAIDVAQAQRVKVVAMVKGKGGGPSDRDGIVRLHMYGPQRDEMFGLLPVNAPFNGVQDAHMSFKSPEVAPGSLFFADPGTYYVSLRFGLLLDDSRAGYRQSPIGDREFKVRLRADVLGVGVSPTPTASTTPTDSPSPTPTDTEAAEPVPPPDDGGSSDTPAVRLFGAAFVVGLLVGFVIMLLRGLAHRPRPAGA